VDVHMFHFIRVIVTVLELSEIAAEHL